MKQARLYLLLTILCVVLLIGAKKMLYSHFNLSPALVDTQLIISGGPPKDGIPALNNPDVVSAKIASRWLSDDDTILGIVIAGKARAYPIRILNWHEIINDHIASEALVISYCPLCGSGVVYHTEDTFGVSGLLYQSDVLLYDKKTESLWSQLMMQAIAGSRSGERLKPFPVEQTAWKTWKIEHPDTDVLSMDTGYLRNYEQNPYQGYDQTSDIYFPILHHDKRLPRKAWVIGLSINGMHKAWEINRLKREGSHKETWKKQKIIVQINGEGIRFRDESSGDLLTTTRLYWFAWVTFYPNTELQYDEGGR